MDEWKILFKLIIWGYPHDLGNLHETPQKTIGSLQGPPGTGLNIGPPAPSVPQMLRPAVRAPQMSIDVPQPISCGKCA
jgi:hypothetical protein